MTNPPAPFSFQELDRLLAFALDSLAEVIPYDLASVFELEGQTLRLRVARGPLAGPKVKDHQLSLAAFPTLARSLQTRRPLAMTEHHHSHGDGDPFDGVLDLPPGHSCMVVPLFVQDRVLGILTFDRSTCGTYPGEVVTLAAVYGEVLGMALSLGEEGARLEAARQALVRENNLLRLEAWGPSQAVQLLATSRTPAMRLLLRQAEQVAITPTPVLILGETGTGKEVLAQALHELSPRRERPFVKLNCAALPENLVESELFGHIKGAFSGAEAPRDGRFLTANGGTLLLDELGELPLGAQAKLLRVLQEGTFEPVGSDRSVRVDVRLLASTNVDLEEAVTAGRFREDLYFRLSVFPLRIPPLRQRLADLEVLAQSLLDRLHARSGRGPWNLSPEALQVLRNRDWPGNVRQLQNVLERATILAGPGSLPPASLAVPSLATFSPSTGGPHPSSSLAAASLAEVERRYFQDLLEETRGKIYGSGGAAERAGLKPSTLQARLKKLDLDRRDFAPGRATNRSDRA